MRETIQSQPPDERERYRRFVERLVDRGPRYPTVVRTLALGTLLHGIAAGLWTNDKWPLLVAVATTALVAEGDESTDDELAAAASLAALALALARTDVRRSSVRDEQTMRYEALVQTVAPVLGFMDRTRMECIAPDLPEPMTGSTAVEAAERVATEVLQPPSPAERAVRLLAEDYDTSSELDSSGAITILEPLPTYVEPRLLRALGPTARQGPIVALGGHRQASRDHLRVAGPIGCGRAIDA